MSNNLTHDIERLKLISTILQQKALMLSTHQKATHALATFERDASCTDHGIIDHDKAVKTRKHLRATVKLAEQSYLEVCGVTRFLEV